MSISFSSSEEFKQDTKNLAKHVQPMKLNQLRHALAAFAGFNSVEAYVAHLDAHTNAPNAMANELDPNIFIHLDSRMDKQCVHFQGLAEVNTPLHVDTKDHWEDDVQKTLIGSMAADSVDLRVVAGVYYPHIRLIRDSKGSTASQAIRHFLTTHADRRWAGFECMDELRRYLLSLVERTVLGEDMSISDMVDLANEVDRRLTPDDFEGIAVDIECGHMPLPYIDWKTIRAAVGHHNAVAHEQALEERGLLKVKLSKEALAHRILWVRAARMFQTMMNRLCVNGKMDVRGREDLARVYQSLKSQIQDDMAVAFFLEETIEYDW